MGFLPSTRTGEKQREKSLNLTICFLLFSPFNTKTKKNFHLSLKWNRMCCCRGKDRKSIQIRIRRFADMFNEKKVYFSFATITTNLFSRRWHFWRSNHEHILNVLTVCLSENREVREKFYKCFWNVLFIIFKAFMKLSCIAAGSKLH